jgi:hypothetical protein
VGRRVDLEAPDLETIDVGGNVDRLPFRPGWFAYRRRAVALVVLIAVVAVGGGSLAAIRSRHHRGDSADKAAARTSPSPGPTRGPTSPFHSNEPLLGLFYPLLDQTDTTTIVLPTGLTVTLSGGLSRAIGGLGAHFFATVTPKNAAACCALSFGIDHAAASDLFTTLGPGAISTPVLVPAALAVQPDLRQVTGRFGILSTGDWTLIASFENGDHTAVADAIVLKLLDTWHLRSTQNGAVLRVPANSTIGNVEANFGRTPDLTDKEIDLNQTSFCTGTDTKRTIGTSYSTTRRTGTWCERGLHVSIEGPRSYVHSVVADLKLKVEPNA